MNKKHIEQNTIPEWAKKDFEVARQVSRKLQKLAKYNELKFTDETLFKDAREKIGEIYPELIFDGETTMIAYNNALNSVLKREKLKRNKTCLLL